MSTIVRPPGAPEGPLSPRRRRRGGLLLAAVIVVVAGAGLAAVALWKDDPNPAQRVDAADGPAAAAKTDEERIVEAVEGYFRVDIEALRTQNPDHPLYTAYATGEQLDLARAAVRSARERGLATRPGPQGISEHRVSVNEIVGERASVEICTISDGEVIHADTGEPAFEYQPGHVGTTLFTAEMVEEFGSWKLALLTREERWDGVAGCAAGAG